MKNIIGRLFNSMVLAAPLMDVTTRSLWFFGEPDFPSEEEI